MKVKRIVFINRAPFDYIDVDLSTKQVISLTGINGAGKTTILSYIVDAIHETARKVFQQEFSGVKEGKLYRVSSELNNTIGTEYSMVYIVFDVFGKEEHYIDLLGSINEHTYGKLVSNIWETTDDSVWPIKYSDIQGQLQHGERYAKYVTISENDARRVFEDNVLTYFPSYRYEQPGYLNDIFRMELEYKYSSDFNGYLNNPIEVTTDLPVIANWMMDVVLDSHMYAQSELIQKIQFLISSILSYKHKSPVRIGIGRRNMGGARIQIVDNQSGAQIYPTIFGISAGEAALLCVFGELIRQTDRLGKNTQDVKGIVLIDEVDKHLHIMLQKEVLPALVQMFPKIQFIITTHSSFVNIGLVDVLGESCTVLDLDNKGEVCDADKNDVFREAYDAMIAENERYASLHEALKKEINTIKKPVVYLEGRTDEKYFISAIKAFGYKDIGIDFRWIGHIDSNGKEAFTGKTSLKYGVQFTRGNEPKYLHFFLFDHDTNKQESDSDNVIEMVMPSFDNKNEMNKGIENALILDDIDLCSFYEVHTQKGDYGKTTTIRELNKMKMCDYICGLNEEKQRRIYSNLKPIIERIINRVNL